MIAWKAAREDDGGDAYDSHNRLTHVEDSRTGVTETTYVSNISDAVASVAPPGAASRKTSYTYDHRGRRTQVNAPDSPKPGTGDHDNITDTEYFPDGSVKEVSGDQTYRVSYTYDHAGRRKSMKTYRSTTKTAITAWNYNTSSGRLTSKRYNSDHDGTTGEGPDYTYTNAGRLASRTWANTVTTDYYYDAGGRRLAIDYSDSTPDVFFTLDALGRTVTEAQGTVSVTDDVPSMASPVRSVTHTHDSATLLPHTEVHDLGQLSRTLVRTYDSNGRPASVSAGPDPLEDPPDIDHFTEYHYGTDGRLPGVHGKDLPTLSGKDYGIEYAYTDDSSHLIDTLTRAGSGQNADLVTTHTWDSDRDVLLDQDNRLDGASDPVSAYAYTVNDLGQRDKVVTGGTAFGSVDRGWNWGYDELGQLTDATHADDSDLDQTYLYDSIGNRLENTVVDPSTSNEVTTDYEPNDLNQYASVTVGGGNPLDPVYDLDGNLTEDGTFNKDDEDREYVWDAENRLVAVNKVTARDSEGKITTTTALLTYAYDSRSRRISRTDEVADTTTWYLYDGWNVVAEYTGATPALASTHTWGTDLSGSLQGAGGVGGLLAVRVHGGPDAGNYYPTYDGNGNVSEYLTDEGTLKAHYEYDPFGNDVTPSGAEGDLHGLFSHRFSTKPFDDVSGWYYYGYRWYDPVTGRWPSRDPIGERGGLNLYGFVGNDGPNQFDVLGLETEKILCQTQILAGHRSEMLVALTKLKIKYLFKGGLPEGSRIGCVSCKQDKVQDKIDDMFPDNVIPDFPVPEGDLGVEDRENGRDGIVKSIEEAIQAAVDSAIERCDKEECPCSKIAISVRCAKGKDGDMFKALKHVGREELCRKKVTVICNQPGATVKGWK